MNQHWPTPLAILIVAILAAACTPYAGPGTRSTPHLERNSLNRLFSFELSDSTMVQLAIYNLAGAQIATPINSLMAPGHHDVEWDHRDDNGKQAPDGVYVARLTTGENVVVRKFVLLH